MMLRSLSPLAALSQVLTLLGILLAVNAAPPLPNAAAAPPLSDRNAAARGIGPEAVGDSPLATDLSGSFQVRFTRARANPTPEDYFEDDIQVSWEGNLRLVEGPVDEREALYVGTGSVTVQGHGTMPKGREVCTWTYAPKAGGSNYVALRIVEKRSSFFGAGRLVFSIQVTKVDRCHGNSVVTVNLSEGEAHFDSGVIYDRIPQPGKKVTMEVSPRGRLGPEVIGGNLNTILVNSRFTGRTRAFYIFADRALMGLPPDQASTTATVKAILPPGKRRVSWKVDDASVKTQKQGTSLKLTFSKPKKYRVTAWYNAKSRKKPQVLDLYVVRATFTPKTIQREPGKDLPPSVPPGKERPITVTLTPSLRGTPHRVTLDVERPDDRVEKTGSARVAPDSIQGSEQVRVIGEHQTEPAYQEGLQVRAAAGKTEAGKSEGFTVCAHPGRITLSTERPVHDERAGTAHLFGAVCERSSFDSDSDSGLADHLNEVQVLDRLRLRGARTGYLARVAPPRAVGLSPAIVEQVPHSFTVDLTPPQNDWIRLHRLLAAAGSNQQQTYELRFFFHCKRCDAGDPVSGAPTAIIPNSGFLIQHQIRRGSDGPFQLVFRVSGTPLASAGPGADATGSGRQDGPSGYTIPISARASQSPRPPAAPNLGFTAGRR